MIILVVFGLSVSLQLLIIFKDDIVRFISWLQLLVGSRLFLEVNIIILTFEQSPLLLTFVMPR